MRAVSKPDPIRRPSGPDRQGPAASFQRLRVHVADVDARTGGGQRFYDGTANSRGPGRHHHLLPLGLQFRHPVASHSWLLEFPNCSGLASIKLTFVQ